MKKSKKLWIGCIMVLLCTMALGMTTFAAGDKTIKNKKWVSGKGGEYTDTDNDGIVDDYKSNGTTYYKFQVPKQGYLMVDVKVSKLPGADEYAIYMDDDEEGECTEVALLNSSKKTTIQENDNSLYEGKKGIKFSAAVKKGTYYLAVEGDQAYKIRYSYTAVGKLSKAGKSLKKPVALKKGVTAKNLIVSSEKDHYYKITLPKKTKINISITSKFSGGILNDMMVALYAKKGNTYKMITEKGKLVKKDSVYYWTFGDEKDTIKATLPKGTYCIRVGSFGPTGYYTLKWK